MSEVGLESLKGASEVIAHRDLGFEQGWGVVADQMAEIAKTM